MLELDRLCSGNRKTESFRTERHLKDLILQPREFGVTPMGCQPQKKMSCGSVVVVVHVDPLCVRLFLCIIEVIGFA
jgi:hypothetical protein